MVSREDMLRELELLPVWQLRNPAPTSAEVVSTQTAAEALQDSTPATVDDTTAKRVFRYITSEDTQWGFILPQSQNQEAEALLQRMLKAVSVNVAQNIIDAGSDHLIQLPTKVIVVMGEQEAQALLGKEETLAQLRGKTHTWQDALVVVTYTPDYLLANVQEKAKVWEDLCLAKLTIANL